VQFVTVFAAYSANALFMSGASAETAADSDKQLAEIVVTAQKRETDLQSTPMSITAVTGEELAKAGISNISDLAVQTPGLAVASAGPGLSQYNLNGISSTAGTSATVGFYLDEVPMSAGTDTLPDSRVSFDPDLYDVARVEVLRGPQGTLYGAGSMGGTIRIVTNQPNLEKQEASVRVDLSDTAHGSGNIGADAMVNLPIVKDVAALRVVLSDKYYSGYIDRIVSNPFPLPTGAVRGNVAAAPVQSEDTNSNTEHLQSVRASLLIKIGDNFTLTPRIYIQEITQGGTNTIDSPPGNLARYQPFDISEPSVDRFNLYDLTGVYQFQSFDIVSSLGVLDRSTTRTTDTSEEFSFLFGAPLFPAKIQDWHTSRQLTEETRIASTSKGPLQWLAGLFFQDLSDSLTLLSDVPQYAPLFGTSDVANAYEPQHLKQYAGFGEATYSFTDQFSVTAGFRWFHYDFTDHYLQLGLVAATPPLNNQFLGASQSRALPKVTFSFAPSDDQLLYATYSQGSRIGGGNLAVRTTGPGNCAAALAALGLTQLPSSYTGDSVDSYEIGAKTRWLDRRLTVNGSLFYINWSDVQQQSHLSCGYPYILNEGSAVSKGAQIEIHAQVTTALSAGETSAYTRARNQETIPGVVTAGEQLQNVPLWTHTAWLEYEQHLADDFTLFGRASNMFYGASHDDLPKPAFDIVTLRSGLRKGSYDGALYVDNLTDKRAILSNIEDQGATIPTVRHVAINRPRTVGIEFNYHF
jgi:iron complex outermembrane recepter protein